MTLPFERTRAVMETEKFLLRLTDPKVTPGLPKTLRLQARSLLRHYPSSWDIDLAVDMARGEKLLQFTFDCPFAKSDEQL